MEILSFVKYVYSNYASCNWRENHGLGLEFTRPVEMDPNHNYISDLTSLNPYLTSELLWHFKTPVISINSQLLSPFKKIWLFPLAQCTITLANGGTYLEA